MITYVINFIICSGLLLLVYRAFLGNENLYRFNRFYLLFSLVFSLAVPFIKIQIPGVKLPVFNRQIIDERVSKLFEKPAQQEAMVQTTSEQIIKPTAPVMAAGPVRQATEVQAPAANQGEVQQIAGPAVQDMAHVLAQPPVLEAQKPNYLIDLLFTLYIIGALVMLFRFIRNGYYIRQTVSQNAVIDYDDTRMVLLDKEVTPHSFWKYIFISKKEYQNGRIAPEIICHEQTHVRQLHSLDVIIVELLQAICWFNPFIPFYRKAIQLNHEFLADEAVIKNYDDTPSYQYLLLAKASQGGSLYITSQFNYLATKKRMIMMTKSTSAKIALAKKVAIIPVLAGVILLFSHWVAAKKASGNKNAVFHVVTLSEWKEIMHPDANHTTGYLNEGDAQEFIQKFNIKYNKQYRLPTREEWEDAVSEGIKTKDMLLVDGSVNKAITANSTPQVYDAANRIFYAVSNDNDMVYLTARMADLYSTEKVLNEGITFTVEVPAETADNKPEKIKNASLTFPSHGPNMKNFEAETFIKISLDAKKFIKDKAKIDSIHSLTNILMRGGGHVVKSDGLKEMLFFPGRVHDTPHPGFEYIGEDNTNKKVTEQYNEQMQYVLKLGMSLKYLGAAINSGEKFRYNIKLNGVPQFDPKKIPTATSGVGDSSPFLVIPANAKKEDIDFIHHTTGLSGEYALPTGGNNSSTEKYGVILDKSRQAGPHAGTPELTFSTTDESNKIVPTVKQTAPEHANKVMLAARNTLPVIPQSDIKIIPPAKNDAPQAVLDEYAAILKKYNFLLPAGQVQVAFRFSRAEQQHLQDLFNQMSRKQQDSQIVKFGPLLLPSTKRPPTGEQLADWQDIKKYRVWIDGKNIAPAELGRHKTSEFDYYDIARLAKTNPNYNKYRFEINLMTPAYYQKDRALAIADRYQIPIYNGPNIKSTAANNDQSQSVSNENIQAISMKYGSDGQAIRFAEKDAPQRIINEYQDILKKSNLPYKKSDQINLTPRFSAADRKKLKALYIEMSRKQQLQQYVRVVPKFGVPGSPNNDKSPTTQQLATWRNTGDYWVYVNNKLIKNVELAKYKPSDFARANVYTIVYPKKSSSKRPGSTVILWTKKYNADYLQHMRASTAYSMTQWGKGHELIVMNNW